MAVLYVTEFVSQGVDLNGRQLPVAALPINTSQTVAIGVTSTTSAAFLNNTQLVRLHTDSVCSVNVSTTPVASATTFRMAANQTEYFNVPGGAAYKVAVITNS
jgi:hypothetical protein